MNTEEKAPLASGGHPTGWSATAKAVRNFDEEKIKECKEDIDTLLVFAGLFSAVLTAFLIASYPKLQPDPNAEVVELLREIASQTRGYTLSSGSPNTTITLQSMASHNATAIFSPAEADLRVNVLWFASLVFSLATASYSILVKSWLREYLHSDYTSLRARLRIRQLRYPGLGTWKVFEIAALLPLLLQVSLALFLLGLCFFTSSIHPSIGDMSTPLVAGWAFFLIMSAIAPIFSSTCPYKTSLLRPLVEYVRAHRSRWIAAGRGYVAWGRKQIVTRDARLPAAFSEEALPVPGDSLIAPRSDLKQYLDEDSVAQDDSVDVTILASIDADLMDDHLFGTTIWESLQEVQPDPDGIVNFLLAALQRRVGSPLSTIFARPLNSLLDLRRLSRRGWGATLDIASHVLVQGIESRFEKTVWPQYMKDAFVVLLSRSDFPLTASATHALALCLKFGNREMAMDVVVDQMHRGTVDICAEILQRFRQPFREQPLKEVFKGLFLFAVRSLCSHAADSSCNAHLYLDEVMESHGQVAYSSFWNAVSSILVDCVANRDLPWDRYKLNAVRYLLSCPVVGHTEKDVKAVISVLLQGEYPSIHAVMRQIAALRSAQRLADTENATQMICAMYAESETAVRQKFVESFTIIFEDFLQNDIFNKEHSSPLNAIRVCSLLIAVHDTHRPSSSDGVVPRVLQLHWDDAWDAAAKALGRFRLTEEYHTEDRDLAMQCLTQLEEFERSIHEQRSVDVEDCLPRDSPVETTQFPDALFSNLARLVSRHGEDKVDLDLGQFVYIQDRIAHVFAEPKTPGMHSRTSSYSSPFSSPLSSRTLVSSRGSMSTHTSYTGTSASRSSTYSSLFSERR